MAPLSLGRRRRIAMSGTRLRSASAPSGSSTLHLPSRRMHMTEILPRPQRYTIWLCGGATTLLAAVVIRPACLVFQTLMRTPTPKWIKSFGGSPAFLGTRSRAIWNILAKRAEGVPVTAAKFRRTEPEAVRPSMRHLGRTNPSRRNPMHAMLAKRTQGSLSQSNSLSQNNSFSQNKMSLWTNEPKRQIRMVPPEFWRNEPEAEQIACVIAKRAGRSAAPPLSFRPNEPEELRAAVTLVAIRRAAHLRKRNAFRSAGSLLTHAGHRQRTRRVSAQLPPCIPVFWRRRLERINQRLQNHCKFSCCLQWSVNWLSLRLCWREPGGHSGIFSPGLQHQGKGSCAISPVRQSLSRPWRSARSRHPPPITVRSSRHGCNSPRPRKPRRRRQPFPLPPKLSQRCSMSRTSCPCWDSGCAAAPERTWGGSSTWWSMEQVMYAPR